MILIKKRTSFKNYIQGIASSGTFGSAYKIVKESKNNNNIDNKIIKDDGTYTENYEEGRRLVLEHNFKFIEEDVYKFINDNIYNKDIEISEVEKIIGEIKNNKAPGYDGITGEMVKAIFKMDKDHFVKLLNVIWNSGRFPNIWKMIMVVLIPKVKKDPHSRDSYRPICLLPVWGKVMDKILNNRLMTSLENGNILSPDQFGYRKGRCTSATLKSVKHFIDINLINKQIVCTILDIKNAFDSIRKNSLLKIMDEIQVPTKLKHMISDYIHNRKIIIKENEYLNYNTGVPQGSSIGPTLWLMIINDLFLKSKNENYKIIVYADDIVILLKSSASYHFTELSKEPIQDIIDWCKVHSLE